MPDFEWDDKKNKSNKRKHILTISLPKTKIMKVSVEEAIAMAKKEQELRGVVITDLNDVQVKAMDALLLAEKGIVIPEQNIYYDDADIAYDKEFDEVEWSSEPVQMTFAEKVALVNQFNSSKEEISLKINIDDLEVNEWVKKNYERVGKMVSTLLVDLYKAQKE